MERTGEFSFQRLALKLLNATRYASLIAVVGSAAGAFLMFAVGLASMWKAGLAWFAGPDEVGTSGLSASAVAVINVIEGLDRFLIALVMLYFAYGVHSLFIRSDESLDKKEFNLPSPLRVRQISQLKQVLAEVIIVILFVLFLRYALAMFQTSTPFTWQQIAGLLVLPVCAALLGAALRLAELHPKPLRPRAIISASDREDPTSGS